MILDQGILEAMLKKHMRTFVPSDKNRVKKIKSEGYFNVTPELAHWRKVREGLIK